MTTKLPKLLQTFPGHYVKAPKKYFHYKNDNRISETLANAADQTAVKHKKAEFDDRYVSNRETEKIKSKYGNDEFKITYEKLWPKQIRNQKSLKKLKEDNNNKLNDMIPKNLIALASFPGSGNTWLRYLLQQATGKLNTINCLSFF